MWFITSMCLSSKNNKQDIILYSHATDFSSTLDTGLYPRIVHLLYKYTCSFSISQAVNSVKCVLLCCTILHSSWWCTTHTQAETSLLNVCWEQVTGALQQYSVERKNGWGMNCDYESCCLTCIILKYPRKNSQARFFFHTNTTDGDEQMWFNNRNRGT